MAITIGPHGHTQITFGGISFDAHRLIYGTVILLVALSLFNTQAPSFTGFRFLDLVVVVVTPLLALSFAHAFADALDIQIRTRRRLTRRDRRHLFLTAIQYLTVGIPVVVLGLVFEVLGWSAAVAIAWGQILGVASLFLWGAFAGSASGLGRWMQFRFAIFYGLVGIGIIVVEVLAH